MEWTRGPKYDTAHAGKDKVGTTVTYVRNDNGDVQTQRDSFSADPTVHEDTVTQFHYSGERLDRTVTTVPIGEGQARTDTADFSYDDFGSVIKVESQSAGPGQPEPTTPPQGPDPGPVCDNVPTVHEDHITRHCFDEFERLVISRGEGVDKPTAYVYDGLDRRDTSTTDAPVAGDPPTHVDYSYIGTSKLLSREATSNPDRTTDVKTYDYDSQGHRLGQSKKLHSDPAAIRRRSRHTRPTRTARSRASRTVTDT